jgi:hypothetical protein
VASSISNGTSHVASGIRRWPGGQMQFYSTSLEPGRRPERPIYNEPINLRCAAIGSSEKCHSMMKRPDVVAELRRDVTYVGNAVVVVMFSAFACLALAATLYDLASIRV